MRATDSPGGANPLLSSILGGTAPRQLKLTAARGVLPLPPVDLLRILVALSSDQDGEVRDEAGSALEAMPREEIARLLADPSMAQEVLDHFGSLAGVPDEIKEALISNPSASAGCLLNLASSLPEPLINLFLKNETKLIGSPDLLDALLINPSLTRPQSTRIQEIRKHFLRPLPSVTPEPSAGDVPPRITPAEETPPPVETEPVDREPAEEDGEALEGEEAGAIEQAVDPSENANQKILRLNTAERIQLAFKGNREERSVLIRDSSRSVQEAVLKSPKLSENEVEGIAKLRTVTEEVLRKITRNREWMKNYGIVHSLSTNPKTPVGIAMNLLSRLNSRDLKLVAGDKNVAEVIRRQARKVQESRTQRPGKR